MTAQTMVRTDEEIQRDVTAELKWDARIEPNEIGVMVTKESSPDRLGRQLHQKWPAE